MENHHVLFTVASQLIRFFLLPDEMTKGRQGATPQTAKSRQEIQTAKHYACDFRDLACIIQSNVVHPCWKKLQSSFCIFHYLQTQKARLMFHLYVTSCCLMFLY